MQPVLQSFIAGLPVLLFHLGVTLAMLAGAIFVYIWSTPHKELALIRDGNNAAALSLSGAILGLAIPLAICMAVSVNVFDIIVWGVLTLVVQIVVFRVVDLLLRDLPDRIVRGEMGPAAVLSAIKLGVAAINAAAVSG
jgi:putative membrane protein